MPPSETQTNLLVGIFVGGRSSRMGGVPKGTLRAPDGTPSLVERLVGLGREGGARDVVLVGQQRVYEHLRVPMLADDPPGIGPLGGLLALLRHADRILCPRVLALACDLPYVTGPIVRRLIDHAPHAAALAPHYGGQWQTMCARYATRDVTQQAELLLARGEHSLQALFAALGGAALPLPLADGEQALLRDWDSPEDIDV
ncbi:MAG TPA: NTP transferase domain-containing protein [Polyangiaceae bacterium]